MKIELANIVTNEPQKLIGFKLFGVLTFYVQYITVKTHIQLCKIREELIKVAGIDKPELSDFYNYELQRKITPLIQKYILTGLLNNRSFSFLYYWFLKKRLESCAHSHILNLYMTIYKLNEPAFFFAYWQLIKTADNTLSKVETPS